LEPAVFLISSIPGDSASPERGHPWLLQERKILEVPHFKRFLRHFSVPSLLRPVCFPAEAYPVGTGKTGILSTIAPNSRQSSPAVALQKLLHAEAGSSVI
jgi:hypothetical protein